MKTKLGVLLVLSIPGLAPAFSVARPASTDGTLQATVGPGYAINLTQNGVKVTHLAPGTYTIQVDDKADIHNFHLFGPGGVNESTAVDAITTATWTVTFVDGTYNYNCDAHPGSMSGKFTVGAVQTTTTTTTPPPVALKVKAKTKVTARTVAVTATATKVASLDFGLWKGTKRVAH